MSLQPPSFSIVVPTYNRPDQLQSLLYRCCSLDYPRARFEVIIVDDGGRIPLDDIVAPFQSRLRLRLLSTDHQGPAAARQHGIRVAQGRYLAFTDDDCLPCSDWLNHLAAAFADHPNCALGGRTCNALPANPYATASQLLITYLYAHFNRDTGDARFFTTNNVAFPAHAFHAIGGLDETWSISGGEDRDLCHRWRHHGYGMVYVPQAVVYHAHALSFRSFWRQHFNYGRGGFHFHRRRARRESIRFKLESLSFYWRIPWFAWSSPHSRRKGILAALLLVSQQANAAGYLSEWLRSKVQAVSFRTAGARPVTPANDRGITNPMNGKSDPQRAGVARD